MENAVSAIILAGGRSSRMGQDKALLPVQGIPMLCFVYGVARGLCNQVYVVTPWPERYQQLLPDCQFIQEIPLESQAMSHGPLVGFAQGLTHVPTEWVLLLACDLPKLQVEVLQAWAAELNHVEKETLALLPRHAKGWEPLCGFYRCRVLPTLTTYIQQGGRSFQQWLAQNQVQAIPLENSWMLFNCNTPTDWASLKDS